MSLHLRDIGKTKHAEVACRGKPCKGSGFVSSSEDKRFLDRRSMQCFCKGRQQEQGNEDLATVCFFPMPLPVFIRINLQFATSRSENASVPADSRCFFSERRTKFANEYHAISRTVITTYKNHKITISQRFRTFGSCNLK